VRKDGSVLISEALCAPELADVVAARDAEAVRWYSPQRLRSERATFESDVW
jgi:hypothetical protein